jgi:hypothetical protein
MVAAGKMLTPILRHCAKQKRTESGLNRKTVQGKFFKDTGVCVDLLVPLLRAEALDGPLGSRLLDVGICQQLAFGYSLDLRDDSLI